MRLEDSELDSSFLQSNRELSSIKGAAIIHCYGSGAGQIRSSPVLLSGSTALALRVMITSLATLCVSTRFWVKIRGFEVHRRHLIGNILISQNLLSYDELLRKS